MKNTFLLPIVLLLGFIGFQSCNDEKVEQTSRVQLKLVDAPGDYQEVNIEIIDIQYNHSEDESGWLSFTPEAGFPINVDLTELISGNHLLLADEIIPAGMIKQIRLILSDNNTLLIEGEIDPFHLDTPSAQQSGLKLKLDSDLKPGFSYTFILDWDVQRSVVKAGNSGKYLLKPVIRVNTEVNSGSIGGKIIGEILGDEIEGPVELKNIVVRIHTENKEYIAATLSDDQGNFLVQGLSPGNYIIIIEDNDYINYESENNIPVQSGEVNHVGSIELLIPVS